MASGEEDAVEDALGVLVNVMEKSANLRNNLRKDILRAVSNIRKEFSRLRCEVEDKHKLRKRTAHSKRYSGLWVATAGRTNGRHLLGSKRPPRTATGTGLLLLAKRGRATSTLWQIDKVLYHIIIKCTNCLLNLKIIKVQNTLGP